MNVDTTRTGRLTESLLAPATPEDTAPTASRRRRLWARLRGSEPVPGLRTLKAAVATALAFMVALPLPGTEPPVVAALTALLVVQVTPYKSIRSGWQRIGSVVAGVLVAILVSTVVGLTWWSLGLTVFAALVIAYALQLKEHAVEVPISAMLVLAVSGNRDIGLERVYETLVGAAIGVLVSLILPRTYVGPAGDAIARLAGDLAGLLRDVAKGLEIEWSAERELEYLNRARGMEGAVNRAREALARAEEGVRLNPSALRTSHVPDMLRPGLTALEYSVINVRVLIRSLVDRVSGPAGRHHPSRQVREAVSRLLDAVSDAIEDFGAVVAADPEGPARNTDELRGALERARGLREEASQILIEDAAPDPAIWRVNGAFLAHVDRLLAELDPDAETVSTAVTRPGRPEPPAHSLRRLSTRMLRSRTRTGRRGRGGR
jgi:uncharacterized membrane protein YccC